MLVPLCFRERPGEKLLPWTKGQASTDSENLQLHSWKQIFKNTVKVIVLSSSILMAVAIFIAGAMMGVSRCGAACIHHTKIRLDKYIIFPYLFCYNNYWRRAWYAHRRCVSGLLWQHKNDVSIFIVARITYWQLFICNRLMEQ